MLSQIKLDIATNAKDLIMNSASLKANVEKNVNELKSDSASLKANVDKNVNELKSDINELKSSDASLKAHMKNSAKKLKLDKKTAIKANRDETMGHIGVFESCVEKVEKSIAAVPDMVETVAKCVKAPKN